MEEKENLRQIIQDVLKNAVFEKVGGGNYQEKKIETQQKPIGISEEDVDEVLFGKKEISKKIRLNEAGIPKINAADINEFKKQISEILSGLSIKLDSFPMKDGKNYPLQFFPDENKNLNVRASGTVISMKQPLKFQMTLDSLTFEPSERNDDNKEEMDKITDFYENKWKKQWSDIISKSLLGNDSGEQK